MDAAKILISALLLACIICGIQADGEGELTLLQVKHSFTIDLLA